MICLFIYFFLLIHNYYTKADEAAAALCSFVNATNINSIYNNWRCNNTDNICINWSGITCQYGKITNITLGNVGISGK